jgi:hypothetical protein
MKIDALPQKVTVATMQTVLDRLSADPTLAPRRRRDLCSEVTCFARLVGHPPTAIALDLPAIRQTLTPSSRLGQRSRARDGPTSAAASRPLSTHPVCNRCSGPPASSLTLLGAS